MKGLKEFLTRGNAVDLAVGVIIGSAFSSIVSALVDQFLNPLIGALFGQPDFDDVGKFVINGATVRPGAILTALASFLIVATALYFIVVLPMNKLAQLSRAKKRTVEEEPEEEVSPEVEILRDIRTLLAEKK